ncbi:DUF3597 family protein [Pseudomonas sp. MWU16-30317]|uniref:DUF3597 family protein n=1 Tax=Pseudomonas sp. MWU16-30317 TaxID=2878095 RepID=UPI0031F9E2C0
MPAGDTSFSAPTIARSSTGASVVDLLKLLDIDSSLKARKTLAMNCTIPAPRMTLLRCVSGSTAPS